MDLWLKVGVNVNLGLQVIIEPIQSYAKGYLWLLLLLNRLLQGKWGTQVQKFKFLLIHEARSGECYWLSSSIPKNCISVGWSKFGALLFKRQRRMVTSLSNEISIYFGYIISVFAKNGVSHLSCSFWRKNALLNPIDPLRIMPALAKP